MSAINVLDISVANLIAAGEVVDRPASAVKEMLENALDAGGRHITVEIKAGGTRLIRVSDDGCGMSREDVELCTLRHATSKIHTAADLDGIVTLGFRGEALAAIASVSRLRIMTKRAEDSTGTLLVSECGEITEICETGCHDGTTVIVEELFANVPARRKFLKRDVTEAMAVSASVEKIALSRPDIAFRFISDGNVKIDTAGDGKLVNTIYSVLGREFARNMLAVDGETEGIAVSGFISSPDNVRGNRNYQNFFINGRYIKSNAITSGLEDAYNSYIPSERFPSCVLNLNIHPAYVDVNVHPSKLEVKFSNDKFVYNAVYCAVRNTLTQSVRRPELELNKNILTGRDVRIVNAFTSIDDRVTEEREKREKQPNLFDVSETENRERPAENVSVVENTPGSDDTASRTEEKAEKKPDVRVELKNTGHESPETPETGNENPDTAHVTQGYSVEQSILQPDYDEQTEMPIDRSDSADEDGGISTVYKTDESPADSFPDSAGGTDNAVPYYRIIGCAFHSYIIVELEDRIMLIDKHAAHERILFEEMKRNMNRSDQTSQLLLIPLRLAMTGTEIDALEHHRNELQEVGFGFSSDTNSVSVTEIPSQLDTGESAAMIQELAGGLADGTLNIDVEKKLVFEKALYQASCKAAMKAGRVDAEENMEWIVERVLTDPLVRFCPHGRPVAYDLTRHDIEHQFKRN